MTNKQIIEDMRAPNLFGIGSMSMQKTSKRVLNMNAIKFKLTKLKTTTIRYEVIYKNLVRDLRKYYAQDFNQLNIMRRKKFETSNFTEFLECYIKYTFSKYLDKLQISMQDLVFNLGSLIYPKQMLKLLKDNNTAKVKVVAIYNYLYKFSLERLQQFLNNESLMLLLIDYLETNRFSRIHASANMLKHRHAYYEACGIMITQSAHQAKFAKVFSLDRIAQPPVDQELEADSQTHRGQQAANDSGGRSDASDAGPTGEVAEGGNRPS